MPEASRGPVSPSSKPRDSHSTPPKQESSKELRGPTAVRGDIPPAGVLEDTKVAATREEAVMTDKGTKNTRDTPTARRTLPGAGGAGKDQFLRGVKREATVEMDTVTGAQVVTSDRLLDPLTGLVVEVLTEPMTEEAAAEAMREVSTTRSKIG